MRKIGERADFILFSHTQARKKNTVDDERTCAAKKICRRFLFWIFLIFCQFWLENSI